MGAWDEVIYFAPMKQRAKPASKPKPLPTPAGRRVSKKVKRAVRVLKTANPITLSVPDLRDQYLTVEMFCSSIKAGKQPIYIGIDPGATGAIGLIHPTNPKKTTTVDIPVSLITLKTKRRGKKQKRTVYDHAATWRMIKLLLQHRDRLVVCLEKGSPRNTDTPLVGYSVGMSYAMWPLFLHSHGVRLIEVLPAVWKRKMGLNGSDKEVSRYTAQKLFPAAPLFNVGHHNRAEALLLAEYIRRECGGAKK